MKIDWTRVPEWIDYVAPNSNQIHDTRCFGWDSKPEVKDFNGTLEFTNWYCEEDDGLVCELPSYVAEREDSDLLDFENSCVERPKKEAPKRIFKNERFSIDENGKVYIHGIVNGLEEIGLKLKELFPDKYELIDGVLYFPMPKIDNERFEFFFQFNEDEPTFTGITGTELSLTIKKEQEIIFNDKKGNKFKMFGKIKNK